MNVAINNNSKINYLNVPEEPINFTLKNNKFLTKENLSISNTKSVNVSNFKVNNSYNVNTLMPLNGMSKTEDFKLPPEVMNHISLLECMNLLYKFTDTIRELLKNETDIGNSLEAILNDNILLFKNLTTAMLNQSKANVDKIKDAEQTAGKTNFWMGLIGSIVAGLTIVACVVCPVLTPALLPMAIMMLTQFIPQAIAGAEIMKNPDSYNDKFIQSMCSGLLGMATYGISEVSPLAAKIFTIVVDVLMAAFAVYCVGEALVTFATEALAVEVEAVEAVVSSATRLANAFSKISTSDFFMGVLRMYSAEESITKVVNACQNNGENEAQYKGLLQFLEKEIAKIFTTEGSQADKIAAQITDIIANLIDMIALGVTASNSNLLGAKLNSEKLKGIMEFAIKTLPKFQGVSQLISLTSYIFKFIIAKINAQATQDNSIQKTSSKSLNNLIQLLLDNYNQFNAIFKNNISIYNNMQDTIATVAINMPAGLN